MERPYPVPGSKFAKSRGCFSLDIIVIYATSFCVNWTFLIARGTRLKGLEGNSIRKAQFTQIPETSCIQNLIVLTILTHFSRPVRNVTLNVLSRTKVSYLLILL
jgi:hypothetical protein